MYACSGGRRCTPRRLVTALAAQRRGARRVVGSPHCSDRRHRRRKPCLAATPRRHLGQCPRRWPRRKWWRLALIVVDPLVVVVDPTWDRRRPPMPQGNAIVANNATSSARTTRGRGGGRMRAPSRSTPLGKTMPPPGPSSWGGGGLCFQRLNR
jgi:hypothetical protein